MTFEYYSISCGSSTICGSYHLGTVSWWWFCLQLSGRWSPEGRITGFVLQLCFVQGVITHLTPLQVLHRPHPSECLSKYDILSSVWSRGSVTVLWQYDITSASSQGLIKIAERRPLISRILEAFRSSSSSSKVRFMDSACTPRVNDNNFQFSSCFWLDSSRLFLETKFPHRL